MSFKLKGSRFRQLSLLCFQLSLQVCAALALNYDPDKQAGKSDLWIAYWDGTSAPAPCKHAVRALTPVSCACDPTAGLQGVGTDVSS